MQKLLSVLIGLLFISQAIGQSDKNTNSIYLGYPAAIFDAPDFGIYLAYDKEWVKRDRISLEASAAYSYLKFDRDSNNFAHDGGSTNTIILVGGPRLYFNKSDKSTRVFINLLVGPGLVMDSEYRNDGVSAEEYLSEQTMFRLGFSSGAYIQIKNKFIFGLALETYGAMVYKLGYRF